MAKLSVKIIRIDDNKPATLKVECSSDIQSHIFANLKEAFPQEFERADFPESHNANRVVVKLAIFDNEKIDRVRKWMTSVVIGRFTGAK